MDLTRNLQAVISHENEHLLHVLDRGIDDMEAGREHPLEEAFNKVTELRDARRNGRENPGISLV